ncbi:unnamed protein product [Parajaminaea phylloscopi]
MPAGKKGSGKSSASSATRKKQAAKKAKKAGLDDPAHGDAPQQKQRGQKKDKKSKKEPKKKVFVPPPKPPQPPPDPLDTLGLASLLPASLVLLLRKTGKKDVMTRLKALEGLANWIDGAQDEPESAEMSVEERQSALVVMLPSWVHLFPRLAASPTRRLRLLTAQIHARLLEPDSDTRWEIINSPHYTEPLLGPWSTLAWDTDRATSASARQSWQRAIAWGDTDDDAKINLAEHLPSLSNYLSFLLIQGSSSSAGSLPAMARNLSYQSSGPSDGVRDAKNRDEANVEEDPRAVDARLAAGALGVLTSILTSKREADVCEEIVNLLHSPSLWSALSSRAIPSEPSFGVDYPIVRARAWELIDALLSGHDSLLKQIVHLVGPLALQAAWKEPDFAVQSKMLDALLPLLSKHPDTWTHTEGANDDASDDDDSDAEESDEDAARAPVDLASAADSHLEGFQEWIQSGCCGHAERFSTILIFLTTLPGQAFPLSEPRAQTFLDAFWTPLASGSYSADRLGRNIFLSSFTECTAYVLGRVSKVDREQAGRLAAEYLGRVCTDDLLAPDGERAAREASRPQGPATSRINALQRATDEKLASTLRNLAALDAAQPLLEVFATRLQQVALGTDVCNEAQVQRTVSILQEARRAGVEQVESILAEVSVTAAESLEKDSSRASLASRAELLSSLIQGDAAMYNAPTQRFIQDTLPLYVAQGALSNSTLQSLASAYVKADKGEQAPTLVRLIEAASSVPDRTKRTQLLQGVLNGVGAAVDLAIDDVLRSTLDEVALGIANELLGPDAEADGADLLARLIDRPGVFVDEDTLKQVFALIITHLHSSAVSRVLHSSPASEALDDMRLIKKLLHEWLDARPGRIQWLEAANLLQGLSIAVVISRFFKESTDRHDDALYASLQSSPALSAETMAQLKDALLDDRCSVARALRAVQRFAASAEAPSNFAVLDGLPSESQFLQDLTTALTASSAPASLSILDGLVPQSGTARSSMSSQPPSYDVDGLGYFTRRAYGLLCVLETDRVTTRSNPWVVAPIILLALTCEDELEVTGSARAFFSAELSQSESGREQLRSMLQRSVTLVSGLLASFANGAPDDWHDVATEALRKGAPLNTATDPMLGTFSRLWADAASSQPAHLSVRLVCRLLKAILSFTSAGGDEATKWLRLAAAIEAKSPRLSEAVIAAAKPAAYEAPFYDRLRNDIVSRLASTPPSKADVEGLSLLRLTLAAAPPVESSVPLVPQQRAMFLLQGLQRWMASDEDFDDEVNTRLAEVFLHVVPIVQDMPGSHLDFFYDLVESNLEVASLGDDSSLPGLYHTLKLLDLLADLARTNPLLRDVHKEHEAAIGTLLAPLFVSLASADHTQSTRSHLVSAQYQGIPLPFELTADLLIAAVQNGTRQTGPGKEQTDVLCSLLRCPMRQVQATSYRMLSRTIRATVQEAIMEMALEQSSDAAEPAAESARMSPGLPKVLVSAVQHSLNVTPDEVGEDPSLGRETLSYLLAWLAIFEHFEEASVQLKSIYANQLQREGLLANGLLPTVFRLVDAQQARRTAVPDRGVANVGPFDPERYAVDEIFLDFVEPTDVTVMKQLATHVYFRALLYVPTLVREWWIAIRDRQYSLAVSGFTTRHCSPLIAARELSHLREPEALSRLQDEAMSIRVLGSSEVVATYTVDEHPMEIGVKIPHDYPLHGVEVRDIRRVGVSEAQWRAWLLAVQQLIVGQNGLVVDALMLFKRNAEAKFAGFEGQECAICYSIISPEDRSLPTKPCKTCKNKFHATCLYKWLHTSGSATCPLCRSIL